MFLPSSSIALCFHFQSRDIKNSSNAGSFTNLKVKAFLKHRSGCQSKNISYINEILERALILFGAGAYLGFLS